MAMTTEWVRYGVNQEYLAFAAWPERARMPLPAVVVLQEIWGVDAHLEDVTRRFAQAGYFALAPDLYARDGARPTAIGSSRVAEVQSFLNSLPPGSWMSVLMDARARETELSRLSAQEGARVAETMGALFSGLGSGGLRLDAYVPALVATSAYLRNGNPRTPGQKVGAVGFCMGGGLAALLACHDPELAAAAIFYGSAPSDTLLARIRCPVMGFYGGLDKRVTDSVPELAETMRRLGKSFESHVYEGAQHAFFNDTRPSYDVRATRDAFARVLELFRGALS